MKRIAIATLIGVWLLLAMTTALASAHDTDAPRPIALTGTASRATEFWRMGVIHEGQMAHQDIAGRTVSPIATFRSYRNTTHIYFSFAAPGSQRDIQATRLYILDRSGTYTDAATLTLEILDRSGAVQHIVSSSPVDLKATAAGSWIDTPLSGNADNLELMPGEFLAAHFSLDGIPEGDLTMHVLFDIEVMNPLSQQPPDPPILMTPPNGTITDTQTVTLTWAASSGAAGYHVKLDSGAIVTTTETTWPADLALGSHTWTVRAFNTAGTSSWATPWTIEITETLPPPTMPRLLAPPNGTITTTHAVTLSWQAGTGAPPTFYHVDVDSSVVTVTGTTSPTQLATGTHTWTVQACNSAGESSYAASWTLEITDTLPAPSTPILIAPPNGTVTTTRALDLVWQAGMGSAPTGYHVDMDGSVVTVTGSTSPTLLAIGTHTWTVQAFNGSGSSDWASPWTLDVTKYKTFLPLLLKDSAP